MSGAEIQHGGDWVTQGMDYSRFRSQGYRFAIRYVVPSIVGKMVTRAEIDVAHNAGVDIAFVYETSGASWNGGYEAGLTDGKAAREALLSLHAPATVGCFHAVDTPTSLANASMLTAWMRGLQLAMSPFRYGVYGDDQVVELAYKAFPEALRWQTKAWSGGVVSQHADLIQLGANALAGIEFDIDAAYITYFGQWYANPALQPVPQSEDNMIPGAISSDETIGMPVPIGSAQRVQLYCDVGLFGGKTQRVRVAVHSNAHGYNQIVETNLTDAVPETIMFTEHDVDAVSFKRGTLDGVEPIGFVIS